MKEILPSNQHIPKNTPLINDLNSNHLSILSYNLLAPVFVRPIDLRTGCIQDFAAFDWVTNDSYLDWETFRHPFIVKELLNSKADVICLQEVQFEAALESEEEEENKKTVLFDLPETLRANLSDQYKYVIPTQEDLLDMAIRNKRVLGVENAPTGNVVLWRTDRLKLVSSSRGQKQSNTRVTVCLENVENSPLKLSPTAITSIHLDGTKEEKRVKQLLNAIRISKETYNTKNIIIAGDMNSEYSPGSVVSRFISTEKEPTEDQIYREFCNAIRLNEGNEEDDDDNTDGEKKDKKSNEKSDNRDSKEFKDWIKLHDTTCKTIKEQRAQLSRVNSGPTRSCFPHDGSKKYPCVPWKLDHILYTSRSLKVKSIWETLEADKDSSDKGTPNANCPSDHIPVAATFETISRDDSIDKNLMEEFLKIQESQLKEWANLQTNIETELPLSFQGSSNNNKSNQAQGFGSSTSGKKKKQKKEKPPPEVISQIQQRRKREKDLRKVQLNQRQLFISKKTLLELEQLDDIIRLSETCKLAMKRIKANQAPVSAWEENGSDV